MPTRSVAIACAVLIGAATAAAQGPGGRGRGGQTVEPIRELAPDLYMVTGGGANTLVRVTGEGLIVVDTKNPGQENYDRLIEEIRSVSSLPVRYVINTQHHPDHVGNNQQFADSGAEVIGGEVLAMHMRTDPRTREIPGVPTTTFDADYMLGLGGATVEARFIAGGHSGGDTMVYFPDRRVVMVSDEITENSPIVDFANGGSAVGWPAILDGVLELDFEMAIPGRGEPKSRAEVREFRDRFYTLIARASAAVDAGAGRDDLASRVQTDDLGWEFNAGFFGSLYDELTAR